AGRERAESLARELGVPSFGAAHASGDFVLDRPAVETALVNTLAFWSHESLELRVADGVDEVALALTADAYARTYRASVGSLGDSAEVVSRHGLRLVADRVGAEPRAAAQISLPADGTSAIDAALAGITARYGPATADFVALQLEYAPARPV